MAKSYPEISTQFLVNAYNCGMSLPEIHEKIGMSSQAIRERLNKIGMKLRGRGESIKNSYKTGRSKSQKGPLNHNWKRGYYTDKSGYIMRIIDRKQYPEHRFVWEQHNGPIPDGWVVHHLNGVRNDNRIENLCAMPRKRHSPITAMEPYQKRIRELEDIINNLKKEAA